MTANWQRVNLGALCTLISGQHIDAANYNTAGRGVGYLTGPSDFGSESPVISKWTEHPKVVAQQGDILITVKGSGVGKINLLNESNVAISRQLMAVRVVGANHRFVHAVLSSTFEHFQSLSTGAAIPGISRDQVLSLQIALPPIDEQVRIVAILDEALEAIATAKVNAQKNLHKVSELFEHAMLLLVDQSGRGITHLTMADVCEIRSKLVDPRDAPYLDQLHVGAGNIGSKTGEVVDVLTARQEQLISGKFEFDDSMVLYSKIRPYLMKVVRPDFSGLCSADIYPLVPKPGVILRDFLYYTLLSSAFTDYAIKGSARAGMPKVNRDHLFAYQMSLPPVEVQGQITRKLDALADDVKNMQGIYARKLAALDELKKSMLHQAFSGRL